jgi:hypothetical protein
LAALAVAAAGFAASAEASPPRPKLWLSSGGDNWHPDNRFELSWAIPEVTGPKVMAVHYRVDNPPGSPITGVWNQPSNGFSELTVPKIPGSYTTEVWLENAAGEQGPAATVQLRFDNVRPGTIVPEPVPAWIGRTAFPLRVRLGHPPGPLPISGIGGYAATIDRAPNGSTCAAADRCTSDETTLQGGAGDDELEIAALPEGTNYLHAVAVSGSGMKSATSGRAVLHVDTTDPVTQLTGVPVGWTNRTVWLRASATDAGSGMEVGDSPGPPPFTAIGVDGGTPTIGLGSGVAISLIDEGAHRIAYYARDAAGNTDDGAGANGIANRAPRTALVRIDRTPPAVAFANSQDPRDPDLLRVRIVDPLSGPDPSRGWIGVRRAGSGDRFEPLPPAPPANGELRARWDSDAYPAGEYEFRASGYDAAGNAAASTGRRDGGPMILSNPLKATTALRAWFHRGGPARTVAYGRRLLLGGRLSAGRNSPLGGTPVRVVERFAAGADPAAKVSTVRTGPDGAFSIRTTPGPSRTIAISFDGSPTLARSAGRTLQLGVRGRVHLQASSALARVGGAPLILRGQVVAQPGEISPAGESVQLQFRLPGLPWAEFRTVQTDRHGRFRYAYRFSDDDSRGVRFQFRAFAPAQEDWPYEPAGSRPVLVRGR